MKNIYFTSCRNCPTLVFTTLALLHSDTACKVYHKVPGPRSLQQNNPGPSVPQSQSRARLWTIQICILFYSSWFCIVILNENSRISGGRLRLAWIENMLQYLALASSLIHDGCDLWSCDATRHHVFRIYLISNRTNLTKKTMLYQMLPYHVLISEYQMS